MPMQVDAKAMRNPRCYASRLRSGKRKEAIRACCWMIRVVIDRMAAPHDTCAGRKIVRL